MELSTGSYQGGSSAAAPGSAAGVRSQGLKAAGLAGNPQVGEPRPSVEGAVGVAPLLGPQVGGPQKQESWRRGDAQPVSHSRWVVESLQQATADASVAVKSDCLLAGMRHGTEQAR